MYFCGIDLFSGIGGFTLALEKFVQVAAYCEKSTAAQDVLEKNIALGKLPRAPICHDIFHLNSEWLSRHTGPKKIDIITAGFPCIGFSKAGKHEGFDNKETALFYEFMRVTDDFKPLALIMENVPSILKTGSSVITEEIVVKRGYSMYWCIMAASDVGAPHHRPRWFCLAVKSTANSSLTKKLIDGINSLKTTHIYKHKWGKEPSRMDCKTNTKCLSMRNAMLGNSVVPTAVQHALLHIVSISFITATIPYRVHEADKLVNITLPKHGAITAKSGCYTMHLANKPPMRRTKSNTSITLLPHIFTPSSTSQRSDGVNMSPFITRPLKLPRWATPVSQTYNSSNILTKRTSSNLPTQLRFEKNTPIHIQPCKMSAVFVEYLMGFPANWTKTDICATRDSKKTSPHGQASPHLA